MNTASSADSGHYISLHNSSGCLVGQAKFDGSWLTVCDRHNRY